MEYVREIRLTTAARKLLISDKNINDIAYDVGYEDTNYFIREFKAAFGFTPNQYRKSAKWECSAIFKCGDSRNAQKIW